MVFARLCVVVIARVRVSRLKRSFSLLMHQHGNRKQLQGAKMPCIFCLWWFLFVHRHKMELF